MNAIYLKAVDKSHNIFLRLVKEERWFGAYHFSSFQAIIDKEPRALERYEKSKGGRFEV